MEALAWAYIALLVLGWARAELDWSRPAALALAVVVLAA